MRPALCILPWFAFAAALPAQSGSPAAMTPLPSPDPRLAALHASAEHLRVPAQMALSPDGSLIAWTIREGDQTTLHLTHVKDTDPGRERLIAPGSATGCTNAAPVWSPDAKLLAYTSTCDGKTPDPVAQPQIYLYDLASGQSHQLTHLKGIFQQAAFSADGKTLAFLFVENATRSAGALAAMKPWSGVIGEDGVEVQRIYAVPVAGGDGAFLTDPALHVYEFAWATKTPRLTYIAANPPGENNWWVAKLYTQSPNLYCLAPPKTGACAYAGPSAADAQAQVVFDPSHTTSALHGLQIAVPRFSPDDRKIAFVGGLMSDQGSTGGDIWVVPSVGGGEPTDVTPALDATPTYLAWTGPDNIGYVEDRRGHTLLADSVVSTRTQDAQVDLGETSIGGGPIKNAIGVSNGGLLAFIKSGHKEAPEIFAGPFGRFEQVTHLNADARPGSHIESIEWVDEGFHVQGWLTYPKDYNPAQQYPLLVTVHGGPSASSGASFATSTWAELGYFVLSPNPRGSFGQGEAFTQANIKDFGYGDLRDILAGMDVVEKKVSIDRTREGLMGWSYGGFMTMFAVTQTHRFRAAVAGAGIADWKSYYGQNSIDQWMLPFFGKTVYDDPAVYARSSAIDYIKNVTTPTLVVVGDRDGECPAPQSFEFWHALRAEGVKTQLVVYPNEGHGFRDPAHIRDLEAREVAWFAKNMPANTGAARH